MSLDARDTRLTKIGTITIARDGEVTIKDFDITEGTCRDVAALAMVHAIGILQEQLRLCIERPGANTVSVD